MIDEDRSTLTWAREKAEYWERDSMNAHKEALRLGDERDEARKYAERMTRAAQHVIDTYPDCHENATGRAALHQAILSLVAALANHQPKEKS